MFVKQLISFLIWVSTIFVSFSHNPFSTTTIPQGTNPLNIESSKIVKYLELHPTTEFNSRVVFVDKDEDYKLVHLMGKVPVDVRYREKSVLDETMIKEEVQTKLDKLKSEFPNQSDVALLSILGSMTETVKISD
jgi:hypothetical protein